MQLERLDHLVLTVRSIDASADFYVRALGMGLSTFGDGRKALTFGSQKINLHEQGREFEPKAHSPTPGSADLCFISREPIGRVISHFHECGVKIIEGPVTRIGALGPMDSVYVRDPDLNLIEVSHYRQPGTVR